MLYFRIRGLLRNKFPRDEAPIIDCLKNNGSNNSNYNNTILQNNQNQLKSNALFVALLKRFKFLSN